MRVTAQQLSQALQKKLAAIYFLTGDEPLQLGEAADAIRAAARQTGFIEREVLTVDAHFEWASLFEAASSNSIFADKKILDLRIPEGKLGTEGAKVLQAYCKNIPAETLLLISTGKLNKDAYKSRWFEALEKCALIVQVKPLEGKDLENWLIQRARQRGLHIDAQGIKLLAVKLEGNLLAAAQEIEKLYVLYGNGSISAKAVTEVVADSSRYDVFKLVDAALAGQVKRLLKILQGLRDEGVALPVVLWALTREARTLLGMQQLSGEPSNKYTQSWDKHKTLQNEALTRLKRRTLEDVLLLGAKADQQIKGQQTGDPWETLLRICLLFTPYPVLASEVRL